MIRLLLVDDHPSVMEGTKVLLETELDIEVTVETNGVNALHQVRTQHFDIMLFDLYMPMINGIELTKKVLAIQPDAIILIYTGFDISPHFNMLVESGVSGFISKTSSREQLITSIRCALRDEVVIQKSLLRELRRVGILVNRQDASSERITLSKKEEEILYEISNKKSNKEISELLLMSQRALEYNITNIFQKLKVKNRRDAVKRAREIGILPEVDFDSSNE